MIFQGFKPRGHFLWGSDKNHSEIERAFVRLCDNMPLSLKKKGKTNIKTENKMKTKEMKTREQKDRAAKKGKQSLSSVTSRAHNLCHDNRQLIVLAINRNRSDSKNNCN